jgi:two-component SAPR family response regulator
MTTQTAAPGQTILALVDDLFFILKICDTAKHLGLAVHFCSHEAEALGHLAHTRPALMIVDLAIIGKGPTDFFTQLGREAPQGGVPILGFTTHADWKRTAPLHDRCTRVVTKETLARSLAALIQEIMQPTPADR